jgi:predicted membrane-bound spermidine synthase
MTSRLRIACGVAIIAAVTLMLELILVRAFDVMMNGEMSHLIISCAMFSFGLSGVYASMRPLPDGANPDRYVTRLAIGFGVFSLLLLPLLNLNPFNYSDLGTNLPVGLAYFALMYLTLMVPFFLSGLIFTTIFSCYASQIRTLYGFDLCGAAVGSVAFIPLLAPIGPGGLLFCALALSLVAAVLFTGKLGHAQKGMLGGAILIALVPFLRHDGYFDFAEHENKRRVMMAKEHGLLEVSRWDPVAKIDIVGEDVHQRGAHTRDKKTGELYEIYKQVAYDGGEQSSRLYQFDGNLGRLRADLDSDYRLFSSNFWSRAVVASHWFRADKDSDVLIIGSAGGQETKAALLYNPRAVDTVEMVSAVVDLVTHQYSNYIGNIFKDPRVHARVGEGRTYLRSTDKKYDIIQIFSNHTSSSMAAGGGAGRGVYLQTVEAYQEYFSSLKSDGILQINHHFYPRVVATAAAAWKKLGRTDFRKHVLVYGRTGRETLPLLLVKMTPWTAEDVEKLNGFMLKGRRGEWRFYLREDPFHPEDSFLSDEFYSGSLSAQLVKSVPYRITPPTDDRPYFNFLRKKLRVEKVDAPHFVNEAIATMLNEQLAGGGKGGFVIPLDVAHYIIPGAVGILFAILFVVVPLSFSAVGRRRWPGEFTSLFYFSCLGAGFVIIELTFVQMFMKLIGIPIYTYSAIIFTMLAAAGLGSSAAGKLKISPSERWWVPYAGTIGFGLLLLLVCTWGLDRFLSAPLAVRILVGGIMTFPTSFFMGMCLPLGILAIEQKPRGAIAWAWGMNGLFTTIGGLAAALLSMFWGFRVTLLIAFAIYALAGAAFMQLRKFVNTPVAAVDASPAGAEPLVEAS